MFAQEPDDARALYIAAKLSPDRAEYKRLMQKSADLGFSEALVGKRKLIFGVCMLTFVRRNGQSIIVQKDGS
jgi:hypothetical protein